MNKLFLIPVLLLITSLMYAQEDQISWFRQNSIPVNSLTDSSDFSDLEPLKEILRDKEIVMLGEGTHGDGSTFAAKNRMVRFLHEQLGFNVIIFEGGFFEGRMIDNYIGQSSNPAGTAGLGLFMWPSKKQSRTLFPYIAHTKKGNAPMHIAGMDCKVHTGFSTTKLFLGSFKMMLRYYKIDSSFINYPVFKSCINNLWKDEISSKPKGDTVQIFSTDLKRLADTLLIKAKTDSVGMAAFWAQNLTSMRNSLEMVWHFKKYRFTKFLFQLNKFYSIRDIQNAQNLDWLINNTYKGEKIIVWAASIHVMHNLQSIKVRGFKKILFNFKNFHNTGDIIWNKYREKTYTIGFTAYEGKKDNLIGNKKVYFRNNSRRNIEYKLNQLNHDYLFLNFERNDLPPWLNKEMKSGICGYGGEVSVISHTVDGIFFFKKMEAAEN